MKYNPDHYPNPDDYAANLCRILSKAIYADLLPPHETFFRIRREELIETITEELSRLEAAGI